MMDIKRENIVVFNEEKHTYSNTKTGFLMTPVTQLIKQFKVPFNGDLISFRMATGIVKQQGGDRSDILRIQKRIQEEWAETALTATTRGTSIHKIIESLIPFLKESDALLIARIIEICGDQDYYTAVKEIVFSLRKYTFCLSEVILYSEKYNVCGTADNLGLRQKSKTSLLDIDDWKTNEVTYDSIKIKPTEVKHYNKFLLPPFEYLEESKYIDFALQLSIYGVLAEEMYGLRIGKLTIHNINHAGIYTTIPMPYIRREAIAMLEQNQTPLKLPILSSGTRQSFEDDDEW